MQNTSTLYRRILADENHWFETSVVIGDRGDLITEVGDTVLFGGLAIRVVGASPEEGIAEGRIRSISTDIRMLGNGLEGIGKVASGEIDLELQDVIGEIPPMAMIVPYVRACTDELQSEWIQQGVFYVDTRETTDNDDGLRITKIHGYDAALKLEQEFQDEEGKWPYGPNDPETGKLTDAVDVDAVLFIARKIGVLVDRRTWDIMTDEFKIPLPAGYSLREILGYIAGAYCGCFVMSDLGDLLLVSVPGIPRQTNYLIDQEKDAITFGENESKEASGKTVIFRADAIDPSELGAVEVDSLIVNLPYLSSGYTGITIQHTGENNSEEITADWSSTAGVIYGGSWNVLTGVVTSLYDEDGDLLIDPEIYQVVSHAVVPYEGSNTMQTSNGLLSLTYVTVNSARILV